MEENVILKTTGYVVVLATTVEEYLRNGWTLYGQPFSVGNKAVQALIFIEAITEDYDESGINVTGIWPESE